MSKKNAWTAAATPNGRVGGGGGGSSSTGYKQPAYAATGNSRIASTDSSRIQDRRPPGQTGSTNFFPSVPRDPDAPAPRGPYGKTPPAYGIMPNRGGGLRPSSGASGLGGSYGTNTASSPSRRPGGSW